MFDLRKEVTLYGWSPKALARGERVVVVINPPQQRNKRRALGRSVSKADGTTLMIPWDRQEIRKALRERDPGADLGYTPQP